MTAALRRSRGYLVGGKTFPSPNVDENDLRAVLEPCFGRENLAIEVCELAEHGSHGYGSIVLARAQAREFTEFSLSDIRSNHERRTMVTPLMRPPCRRGTVHRR
jgi:hypothetical protein